MKKMSIALLLTLLFASNAMAKGQVFYRYGQSMLSSDRGEQTFTDTLGADGKNNDDSGMSIGAGLDLELFNCPLVPANKFFGEIFVNYSRFSQKEVVNAIDYTLDNSDTGKHEVTVSSLEVTIAPKYQFNLGKLKPWIIPAGLSYLVNSPPSNTTSYLDIGYHAGVGLQYDVLKKLSLGVDARYTYGIGEPELKTRYTSFGGYLGINF